MKTIVSLKYFVNDCSMSNKTIISNFNAMEDHDTLTFYTDTRSISTVFKNFFSKLAESFLTKLPNLQNKYNLEYVMNYQKVKKITTNLTNPYFISATI